MLATQAQSLAGTIYTAYPPNWTAETVISPGFVIDHRIDEELFAQFQELDSIPAINHLYYVNTTLGSAGTPPSSASNVYALTRYAVHNGSVTPIEVIIWQE